MAETLQIEKGKSDEEIENWNNEIDLKIETADIEIGRLENWPTDREQCEQIEAHERQLHEELKLDEQRVKMKAESGHKSTPEIQECTGFKTAKPPKLVISKFEARLRTGLGFGRVQRSY